MSYEWDAERLAKRLGDANLLNVTDSIQDGLIKPGESVEVDFTTSSAMNSGRFLIYSFLKLTDLKSRFRVSIVGPVTLRITHQVPAAASVRKVTGPTTPGPYIAGPENGEYHPLDPDILKESEEF